MAQVILGGGASGTTLGAAMGPVAEHYNAQQGVAPLNGTCSVTGGKVVVVCTPGAKAPAGVPGTAFGTQVVWGEEGVWSLFQGKGPNVLKAPEIVILAAEDKSLPSAATLTPSQAAVYLLGLQITPTANAAENFASMATASGASIVLCNSEAAAAKYAAKPAGAKAAADIDPSSALAIFVKVSTAQACAVANARTALILTVAAARCVCAGPVRCRPVGGRGGAGHTT
jgi:hypothetical protein